MLDRKYLRKYTDVMCYCIKNYSQYNYWHLFEEKKELAYKRMSEIVSKRKCDDPVSEFVEIIKQQSKNLI